MRPEERDQRLEERRARRLAEDRRAGTRYVMREGEAWLAMQSNVPVEELRTDRSWGEARVSVVRNSVAAYAERLLEALTGLVKATGGRPLQAPLRGQYVTALDLLEDLPAILGAEEDPAEPGHTQGRGALVVERNGAEAHLLEEGAGAGGGLGLVAVCELVEDADWFAAVWNRERSGKG